MSGIRWLFGIAPPEEHLGGDPWGRASCPPWPVPYNDIRLQFVDDKVRVLGHPSHFPWETMEFPGPPFLYLSDYVPAYVNFVMGPDWRSRLTTVESREGRMILKPTLTKDAGTSRCAPTWDLDEEEQHCSRMLRCGAVIAYSDVDILEREMGYWGSPRQPSERQMFGWPEKGGVWVFRQPLHDHLPLEEQVQILKRDPEGLEQQRYRDLLAELRNVTDMETVCDVLKNAGGRYYSDAADCPEVQSMGIRTT